MLAISVFVIFVSTWGATAQSLSPEQLASSFNLGHTLSLTFPSAPISNTTASSYITSSNWIVTPSSSSPFTNPGNVQFVADPFPNTSPQQQNSAAAPSASSPTVLQVVYPADSFTLSDGGAQFSNFFNTTASGGTFQSMMLTYEVAFGTGFQFVKGGKLPGLRGGPSASGCGSGGHQPDGTDCFSTRLMWRTAGAGEVYAYLPTPNNLCSASNVMCNDDGFGVSFSRGVFSFVPATWTRITMLVQLNDPKYANGQLLLYFNDRLAIKQENLYFRSSDSINSIQGLFFSTFFGGNDNTWETPTTQYSYFRNMELWAATPQSNVTGAQPVEPFGSAASRSSSVGLAVGAASLLAAIAAFIL